MYKMSQILPLRKSRWRVSVETTCTDRSPSNVTSHGQVEQQLQAQIVTLDEIVCQSSQRADELHNSLYLALHDSEHLICRMALRLHPMVLCCRSLDLLFEVIVKFLSVNCSNLTQTAWDQDLIG